MTVNQNDFADEKSIGETPVIHGVDLPDAHSEELLKAEEDTTPHEEIVDEVLESIFDTPMLRRFQKQLETVVGTKMDLIILAFVLLIISAKLKLGINICLVSSTPVYDSIIRNQLFELVESSVIKVATPSDSRKAMHAEYKDVEIVSVIGDPKRTFPDACQQALSMSKSQGRPSVVCVNEKHPGRAMYGPALELTPDIEKRELRGVAESSATPSSEKQNSCVQKLQYLFRSMGNRPEIDLGGFRNVPAILEDHEKLVFVSLLRAFAALRRELEIQAGEVDRGTINQVGLVDYRRAYIFLTNLPVPRKQSQLSPQAAATGRLLFDAIQKGQEIGSSIPDHSNLGCKNFTRNEAIKITDYSYNTVKTHLQELEDAGILEGVRMRITSGQDRVKRQGCQIYYRFTEDAERNIDPASPYFGLKTPEEVAANCR